MLCGMVITAYFHLCDPLKMNWIEKSDQYMPYLASIILSRFPGCAGLYVAGVYAASLSTVSSGINSISSIALDSVVKPLFPGIIEKGGMGAMFFSKLVVLLSGALAMAVAYLASNLGAILAAGMSSVGALNGLVHQKKFC